MTRLSGAFFAVVASRFPHGRASARPGIGGIAGPLPVATTTACRATSTSSSDPDPPLAVEPRRAPRTSVTPRSSSHGTCEESSRSWITSSRRASTAATSRPVRPEPRHPLRLGEQLARAQQRLRGHARVVGALAADEVLLDERDLEPGLAEPPGGDLAGRAGADHDDVEAPFGHGRV